MLDWDAPIDALTVKFWGVRGAVPSSGPKYQQYGGNTSCVEINLAHQHFIFDAGTGLCALGHHLLSPSMGSDFHLFLSETQWGRTQGFAFFGPAFEPDNCFWLYGPVAITGASMKHQLMNQLRLPYSDISLRHIRAHLKFQDLRPAQVLTIPSGPLASSHRTAPIRVEALLINSSSLALGYSLSWRGLKVIYAAAIDPDCDLKVLESLQHFVSGADVLIYGEAGAGWQLRNQHLQSLGSSSLGHHSSPSKDSLGILRMLLRHVKVGQVIVTQHGPFLADDVLQYREKQIQASFDKVRFAREGMKLSLQLSEALQPQVQVP